MYTREELGLKKYGELLKILKSFGGKGGRQKTEKVIDLILAAQDAASENKVVVTSPRIDTNVRRLFSKEKDSRIKSDGEEIDSNEKDSSKIKNAHLSSEIANNRLSHRKNSNCLSSLSPSSPMEAPRPRLTRSQTFEVSNVEEKTEIDERISPHLFEQNPTPLRESTFVLRNESHNQSSVTLLENETLSNFSQSVSFTLNSSGEEKCESQNSLSVHTEKDILPNLLCDETEAVADTECLENAGVLQISPRSGGIRSPLRARKTMRRSLRGQLLEAKVCEAHENYLATKYSTSPKISTLHPLQKPPVIEEVSNFPEETPVPQKLPAEEEKKEPATTKSSGIPRFVNFAFARKMPNFSRIHQKAFKKMEALDEYVERKHSRTKSFKGSSPTTRNENGTLKPRNADEKASKECNGTDLKKGVSFANSPKNMTPRMSRSAHISGPKNSSEQAKISEENLKDLARKRMSNNHSTDVPKRIKENVPFKMTSSNTWNKTNGDPNTPGSLQRRKSYNPNSSKTEKPLPLFKPYQSRSPSLKEPSEISFKIPGRRLLRNGEKPVKSQTRILHDPISRKETLKQLAKRQPKLKSR